MSRLAGLYRLASHVPQSPAASRLRDGEERTKYATYPSAPTGASFGPWATHAARCTCNVCR